VLERLRSRESKPAILERVCVNQSPDFCEAVESCYKQPAVLLVLLKSTMRLCSASDLDAEETAKSFINTTFQRMFRETSKLAKEQPVVS
jgi:hypothetical protein